MTLTKIVHIKDKHDVYIGRPSKWGNPFEIGKDGTRSEVIEKYRNWLLTQPELLSSLHELDGKILGCHCKPKACHGDILIEQINLRNNLTSIQNLLNKNIMKIGYKATNNMKCRDLTYEVGKTYETNTFALCEHGLHYCETLDQTHEWYNINKDIVFIKVEILGDVIEDTTKCVTNKFKVLEVVPNPYLTFDDNKNLIKKVFPDGRVYTYEYDLNNNKIKEVTPCGRVWTYEYDSNNNLIKKITPNGYPRTFEYDSNKNKIKEVSPNGDVWTWEYNSNNNKIKEVFPNGDVYTWKYDSNNNLIEQLYPDGDVLIFEYDSNNNRIKEGGSFGSVCTYEYDSNNNKIKKIDQDGGVWTYEYDSNKNRIKQVCPTGDVWTYEYNSNNIMTKEVTPSGNVYIWEYDSNNNKIKEVYPSGKILTVTITD